ncbi:carbonic anhydrase family protein [Planktosalinus lacus]|uniref:Carbonic anhydrase n=1 Tax=Planktosalinus lacus TaxID=1526573 RepID=A0A8J2Y8K3_9FLAO|nr:carbonic anhydrase family protein [Planktosalinus lacus]GGD81264.1 carbonic anhydrase [Planktosalinus lacus]
MKKLIIFGVSLMLISLVSCNDKTTNQNQNITQEDKDTLEINQEPLVNKVLSKEERDAMTPDEVLQIFKDGNMRFMNNDLTVRDHSKDVRETASGQYPKAVVLSCIDSRVPVEDVFDRGIGDIFVGRVAGNFANEDQLGGMEFATKVSGSKLVLVMGHEHCGAVKAAVDDVKLGNISGLLSNIRPVVEQTEYEGDRTSSNQEFVDLVCENNVRHTIEKIRANSSILKEMEEKGEIKIVGGVYDLDTGEVIFLE